MVVSGVVKEANIRRSEVVIENEIYAPISKKAVRKRIRFTIKPSYIQSLGLESKLGSFIMVTVRPTPALSIYADGGEDGTEEFVTSAFNMRFSGSFDFEPLGKSKEAHVFCAPVKETEVKTYGNKKFVFLTVSWKKQGENETRKLVVETGKPEDFKNVRRGIFVTSARQSTSEGPVYRIKDLILQ